MRKREREREWEKTKSFDPRFSIKIKMTSAAAGGERSFMNSYTAQVFFKVLAQTIARSAFPSLWSEQFPKDTHRLTDNLNQMTQILRKHSAITIVSQACYSFASLFSTPKDLTSSACHVSLPKGAWSNQLEESHEERVLVDELLGRINLTSLTTF